MWWMLWRALFARPYLSAAEGGGCGGVGGGPPLRAVHSFPLPLHLRIFQVLSGNILTWFRGKQRRGERRFHAYRDAPGFRPAPPRQNKLRHGGTGTV